MELRATISCEKLARWRRSNRRAFSVRPDYAEDRPDFSREILKCLKLFLIGNVYSNGSFSIRPSVGNGPSCAWVGAGIRREDASRLAPLDFHAAVGDTKEWPISTGSRRKRLHGRLGFLGAGGSREITRVRERTQSGRFGARRAGVKMAPGREKRANEPNSPSFERRPRAYSRRI